MYDLYLLVIAASSFSPTPPLLPFILLSLSLLSLPPLLPKLQGLSSDSQLTDCNLIPDHFLSPLSPPAKANWRSRLPSKTHRLLACFQPVSTCHKWLASETKPLIMIESVRCYRGKSGCSLLFKKWGWGCIRP